MCLFHFLEVRAGVNATPENVVKAYKEVILGKMKK